MKEQLVSGLISRKEQKNANDQDLHSVTCLAEVFAGFKGHCQ